MGNRFFFGLLIITVVKTRNLKANAIDNELINEQEFAIKKRISELTDYFFPMPEDQFKNILEEIARLYIPVLAQDDDCRNHSNYLLQSFLQGEMWALRMLDAGSKLMPGVLDGHFQDLGNYEQCISIDEPAWMFSGQHCVIDAVGLLPKEIDEEYLYFQKKVTLAICIPSSCTVEDVAFHMDQNLAVLNASTLYTVLKFSEDQTYLKSSLICSSADPLPFRTKDYVALSVFCLIAFLIIACTFYESKYGLSAFSLRSNFRALMDPTAPPSEITCLNGVRVIFIFLLIMYHRAGSSFVLTPSFRYKTVLEALDSHTWIFFEFISKSLDVFFMVGGTVLSYNFFKNQLKGKPFNVIYFYLHRYFRLTPALAAMMLFYGTLFIHTSRGPLWTGSVQDLMEVPCIDSWWPGLLQISNYYVSGELCVGQSWYVAADFQFHLLAPLILVPLLRRPKLGVLQLVLCFLSPIVAVMVDSYINQLYSEGIYNIYVAGRGTNGTSNFNYRGIHYHSPAFVLGLALGYVLFNVKKTSNDVKFSKLFFLVGWTITCSLMIGSFVASTAVNSTSHQFDQWLDPLYNGLDMPVYCGCFAWIIFACALGFGGVVNRFLSWGPFRPLAKLTYGVYLVHEVVVAKQILSIQVPIAFTFVDYWFLVCGDIVFSFAVALPLYLFVEIPCTKLASKLIEGKNNSGQKVDTNKQAMTDLTVESHARK